MLNRLPRERYGAATGWLGVTKTLTWIIVVAVAVFFVSTFLAALHTAPVQAPSVETMPATAATPDGLGSPVEGVRADMLVDTYRAARNGGRVHDAIDIMAPEGASVVAAAPGTVEKLYFSRGGGGITVYVRAPDRQWVYYYAHLRGYAPGLREGQQLVRGDLIGFVGHSGNASPAAPHLHFAIHRMAPGERWWQGTAINPYPLLAGSGRPR